MHREIHAAVQQRCVDLLREQALAAEIGQGPVQHPVATCGDHLFDAG
jgi:hypothetical protein